MIHIKPKKLNWNYAIYKLSKTSVKDKYYVCKLMLINGAKTIQLVCYIYIYIARPSVQYIYIYCTS